MLLLKKLTWIILFFLLLATAKAQTVIHSASEVANAEKSFAKRALETNTRQAFLEFYADSVIGFRNGNPVHVKEEWKNKKPDSAELWWQPVFADIAYSGDFGYTTGPWEWKKMRTDEKPSAYGYYNSVWKKGNDGTWRVVIDIGIPTGKPSVERNIATTFPAIKARAVAGKYESLKEELFKAEKAFLSAYQINQSAGYNKYISADTRVYRPYNLPYVTTEAIRTALTDTSLAFRFELVDGDIASSGDMGFVYGKVKATGTFNGQAVNANLNYMRIWKRGGAADWKIVLDVIGGQ